MNWAPRLLAEQPLNPALGPAPGVPSLSPRLPSLLRRLGSLTGVFHGSCCPGFLQNGGPGAGGAPVSERPH